jgi:hypothetical protein
MNKPLLVFATTLAGLFTAPASAQVTTVSSVEAQEAVRTYDRCLARAMVRAERAGTPLELRHGVSMRSCKDVRSTLLSNAEEGSEIASALEAVDQIRETNVTRSTRAAFGTELANLSDVYLMEKLAWRRDRETFTPRSEMIRTSVAVRSQTTSQ